MFKHEDKRRVLYDWAQGEFKAAKAVLAKRDCTLGDHYHRDKDESFFLLVGSAVIFVGGTTTYEDAPYAFHVPRGTWHKVELMRGSILLGTASEEFDPEDEVPGKP